MNRATYRVQENHQKRRGYIKIDGVETSIKLAAIPVFQNHTESLYSKIELLNSETQATRAKIARIGQAIQSLGIK